VYLWRHRFLVLINTYQAQHEEGIVETDETFFLNYSKSCVTYLGQAKSLMALVKREERVMTKFMF
jgi:hypothetical protein